MNLARDLTNQQFGHWTVLHRAPPPASKSATLWECRCSCGTLRPVNAAHLIRQRSRSCGCQRVARRPDNVVHAQRNPTYRAWMTLRSRHTPVWTSFDQFVADMGQRSPPRTTLRRIDPTLPHGPGNCRWATPSPI